MSSPLGSIPQPSLAQPTLAATKSLLRRRPWKSVILGVAALATLLVWFAPAIIAKTTLRNRLVRNATADLNGTLDVGAASLGWLSRVELRDVTLTDSHGRVVARVPKLYTGKSLLSLLRDRNELGEITLEKPNVEIVCEKSGTNVEDVLVKILDDTTPQGVTRTPLVVRVTGGTLTLRDGVSQQVGEIRDIEATVSVPRSRDEQITAKATATARGQIEVDVSAGEAGRIRVVAEDFALESLAPLLARFAPDTRLAGTLAANLTAQWEKNSAAIEGNAGVRSFWVTSPALNGDTLRLESAELPLKVAVTGSTVRIDQARVTSDVGSLSITGTFDPSEPIDRFLDRPGVKLDGTVEIAKLAGMLPKLLSIRDGTDFREGRLVVKIESRTGDNGVSWEGGISTSSLRAMRAGKEIQWDEPLTVEFAGRANPGRLPSFDKLECKSDFIAVNAQISPDSVRAAANIFLDKLAERLRDFVDLGSWTLDGRGSLWVIATRAANGRFKADGGLDLNQFVFADQNGKGLREPTLKVQLASTGTALENGSVAFETAKVDASAGMDDLVLTLLDPITDAKHLTGGKLDFKLGGDLARWRNRLAIVMSVPKDYKFAGTVAAHGVVRFGGEQLAIDGLSLSIDKARLLVAGIDIDEPKMNAKSDLTVDLKSNTATFDNLTLNAAPLSVSEGKLVIEAPTSGALVVHGAGPSASDLNRLGKSLGMYADSRGPGAVHGRASGPIEFRYTDNVTTFKGSLDVAEFAYGTIKNPDWAEKRLLVELDGSYRGITSTLTLTNAKVERPGLAVTGSGTIGSFGTTTDANLIGSLTYDMTRLTPKLRELLGGNFAATGQGSKPFNMVGSLTPLANPNSKRPPNLFANLKVEVGLSWDSIKAYGFDVGPSVFEAKLAEGFLRATPVRATFGGGKVMIQPTARLDPAQGGVVIAKGLIVDRAKLTPAVCASALGYALPAIAHSSKAEGEISITLDDNHIPLADTSKAKAKASVHIHNASVSAGPVVGAIATLLGAEKATTTLANDQWVPVRIENGRVYHENLSIKLGGYFLKTTGSVGFDGSVDMVADVPIPGGLPGLKNTPMIAKALSGKRVNIPVRGTLTAPVLDPKAFQAAIAKLARDAAKDVGNEVLNKELGKIFPGGIPGPGTFLPIPKK